MLFQKEKHTRAKTNIDSIIKRQRVDNDIDVLRAAQWSRTIKE